ncbi:MAG: hypothetical protein K2M00_00030, partial [Muribaculaceae bacterium]|nr:hypothetical protein [Muribaculaceae bacterium]
TTNGEEGGLMADLVATGSFVNGGGLYIHPLEGATGIYELYWFGGFNQGAVCAAYEIEFPGAVRPEPTPAEPVRNAFAYGVNGTQEGTVVNITYTATAPALEAVLVLTDVENAENVFEYDLPAPKVGVNEVAFAIPEDLPGSKYNWAVSLSSANNEGETPAIVFETVGDPATTWGRGGLVTITDPAYASYGYTVVANSRGLGLDVYAPEGDFVGNYKPEFPGAVGNSCPLRGDQRFGKAVFASWGDPNSGLYEFDPLNPEAGVKQIVEGERDGKGIFTYNGVQTVSSTPCVAFVGKGEETMMWTFDEDIYANTIVGYPVGNAETVTVPASIVCNPETTGWNSASAMLNNAVCFEPAPNGLFSAQNRANGMDQGVPAFIYMDNNGELI